MQILVRMAAAFGSAGNVIKIIDALDFKGDMAAAFDEGEVAPRLIDLGQVDHLAFGQAHEFISSSFAAVLRRSVDSNHHNITVNSQPDAIYRRARGAQKR